MSLFEWLGESMNPGPIGTVDVGSEERRDRSGAAIVVCFAISAVLLGFWACLLLGTWHVGAVKGLLGTATYLVLAYFVHPRPDFDNIGWLGGLFDHPFRYSDDVNRFLMVLVVVLWPGRFVAESLAGACRLLARVWRS